MSILATQYLPILVFAIIAFAMAVGAVVLGLVLGKRRADAEKASPYECGFEPIGDNSAPFNVRFYIVAMLFVIFDLEIAFLFPWAVHLKQLGVLEFWSMMGFLAVLTIGLVYEWKKGALEWD